MQHSFLILSAIAVAAAALPVLPTAQEPAGTPPMAKPGEQHKILAKKVGTWQTTTSIPGSPGASKGVFTARIDLGGLWLVGDFRGDFMGTAFSGHEVSGYDAKKKKYVTTWVDSWMDHVTLTEGDWDAKTSTLTMWTDGIDARTGKQVKERQESRFIDADHWMLTMSQPDAKGDFAPFMTVAYERKASFGQVGADIERIVDALERFARNNTGQYPDELEVLVTADEKGVTYLGQTALPKDPWKRDYHYEPPLRDRPPRVWTFGKDGATGGDGDDRDIDNFVIRGDSKRGREQK